MRRCLRRRPLLIERSSGVVLGGLLARAGLRRIDRANPIKEVLRQIVALTIRGWARELSLSPPGLAAEATQPINCDDRRNKRADLQPPANHADQPIRDPPSGGAQSTRHPNLPSREHIVDPGGEHGVHAQPLPEPHEHLEKPQEQRTRRPQDEHTPGMIQMRLYPPRLA